MDLFSLEQNNNTVFKDDKVVVYCEKTGRRYNTYVVGLELSDEDYKTTLKKLTKTFGCGGAIKTVNYDVKDNTKAINIQGNFVVKTGEILKSLNIKNLIIKELVE